jgi:antitoxin (DNA-binding transcriptional repressor) of toxin-antitoxin stability system
MATKITATELARNLSDILNRVRYKGESFEVMRGGETIAEITGSSNVSTVRDFVDMWKRLPPADDKWADDLEAIHEAQGTLPVSPWE